jgi:hypothetical protein
LLFVVSAALIVKVAQAVLALMLTSGRSWLRVLAVLLAVGLVAECVITIGRGLFDGTLSASEKLLTALVYGYASWKIGMTGIIGVIVAEQRSVVSTCGFRRSGKES